MNKHVARNTIPTERRVLVGVLVLALALTTVASGDARADDPGHDVVYVSTGRNFPDALTASVVAALNGAPLLLVDSPPPLGSDTVPEATADELTRLAPIARIVVFGGPPAVSDAVFDELGSFTDPAGEVERVAGLDRFETAAMISQLVPRGARDADKLDGLDSTAFALADHDHDHDHDDRYVASEGFESALAAQRFVRTANGVGSNAGCASDQLSVVVTDGLGAAVDHRFTFQVPGAAPAFGQIRSDGSVRNGSSNISGVVHTAGTGTYCITFDVVIAQSARESATVSIHTG